MSRVILFLMTSWLGFALAQVPLLPPEHLQHSRQLAGDQVRFCVVQDQILTDLNSDVARLLADTLLIEAVLFELSMPSHVQPLGYYSPLTREQLLFLLTNDCDAFMGYLYGVGTYPDWLVTTVPYLNTRFVLVTRDESIQSLEQVPYGSRVGTQLGSTTNSRFLNLVRNLPENRTWRRVPYPDNQILLERLADGTLDAALAWEPAVVAFADPALKAIDDLGPVPPQPTSFIITMISDNSYLLGALDMALAAVKADGSLQALVDSHGIPATVPR